MRAPSPSRTACWNPSNTKQLRELVHVLELLDVPEHVQDRFDPVLRHPSPARALAELLGELVVRHRIAGAALAEVGLALDDLPVVQLDRDDRGHLVEARGL